MKHLLFIIALFSTSCFGQTYEKFTDFSKKQLIANQRNLSNYYQHFLSLLSKRDTSYLKEKLTRSTADNIYIIEAYNFETNKYSLFEEYKINNKSSDSWGNCELYLDKELKKITDCNFLYEPIFLRKDSSSVDTIFPRKYRYGAGCVVSDTTFKIFRNLEFKAKQDGIVIEKYCKIETFIDKAANKIFIRYLFPVSGQREFEDLGIGWGTDYPPGLDFWLFESPYFVVE